MIEPPLVARGPRIRDKAAMHAPATAPVTADPAEAAALTRRITALSVGVAAFLIAIKAFAWGASGSVSVLASLVDSGLDLIASLVTFFAVRWAAAPPDAEHRYGHGKAEAFASLVQAGLVFASAIFIGWEAVHRILEPRPILHGAWGVGVMAVSIVVTGLLVAAQTRALRRTGSVAVQGDRAHYFADLASNGVAMIGVASAAWLAAPGLDAAAGLVVAVWLFWGAVNVLKEAADHLLDRALPPEALERIVALVTEDPRITGVHQLRTRAAGHVWLIQFHADLDPNLTLEAAHAIVVEAEQRILQAYPNADILIHPDPRGRAEPHGGLYARSEEEMEAEAAAAGRPGPWDGTR